MRVAFGRLPDALAAASYDAVQMIAAAIAKGGAIDSNLSATTSFRGVQGVLTPAGLLPGEISSNAVVTRLNEYGTASVVARYPGEIDLAVMIGAPDPGADVHTRHGYTCANRDSHWDIT